MVTHHTFRHTANRIFMEVVTRVELPLDASMLEQEDAIQAAVNEAGLVATRALLECYDTHGQPLMDTSPEGGAQQRLTAISPGA